MVETGGLENRLRGDSHGGSNPSSSARFSAVCALLDKASSRLVLEGPGAPAKILLNSAKVLTSRQE